MDLSKWRYKILRDFSANEGNSNYPSYYAIVKEKSLCYPPKEDITITEISAKIKMQALLDLTTKRLLKTISEPIIGKPELVLVSKWGFDGSSSQSTYHQSTSTGEKDSSSAFMASLVPLRLLSQGGDIIWQNERSSSTSLCRPIMFKFMKETEFNVKREMADMEMEIKQLNATTTEDASVKHQLILTMIDGKIHSYISETSAAVCDICKARPSQMNDLDDLVSRPVDEGLYQYGLSTLHAWIRSMECMLHISYKLDIKKWQAKGDEAKKLVNDRKISIQEAFRKETGLLLDVVKQGSGTTNNGNSARRFFENPEKSAELSGLDVSLLKKICVILQCVSSGEKIIIDRFRDYCKDTAKLYVELYPWYYMPSSLHKLLVHGPAIVQSLSIVPIGFLSEEASEARNKDFRNYREGHSRKSSSISCNEDIMHNLLLSSDPLISSMRPKFNKFVKKSTFTDFYNLVESDNDGEYDFEFVDATDMTEVDSESESHDIDSDED